MASAFDSRRHGHLTSGLCRAVLVACAFRCVQESLLFSVSSFTGQGSRNFAEKRDRRIALFAETSDAFDLWAFFGSLTGDGKDEARNVLEISNGASQDEVRKAYKRLIAKCHPDIDASPEAEVNFSKIVRALAILTGEDRELDDATLLNNAMRNLRDDVYLKSAKRDIKKEGAEPTEAELEEAEYKREKDATEVGIYGGAALGLMAGPSFAILGALAGLAFGRNDDATGRVFRNAGKLAKGTVDVFGKVAIDAAVRTAAYMSRPLTAGQQAKLIGPPEMAGKQVTVEAVRGKTCTVRLETGITANVATRNIKTSSKHQGAAAPTAAEEGMSPGFTPGNRVTLLGPPAMAGKQGTILGPAADDAFEVQFESGSVFSIANENIRDAAALEPVALPAAVASTVVGHHAEKTKFKPGQRVTLLGPPAMAGKQATVLGHLTGEMLEVQFDSGSVFNIATDNILDVAPLASAQAAATGAGGELEFIPGQRVTLLGPPAMAGKRCTIAGPALGNTFAVEFDTGSVFNIAAGNIVGAAAPAPQPVAALQDKALEFTPGQRAKLLGPPAMAGKRGTILGSASGDKFEFQFDSGSVLSVARENIQEELQFMPGQLVILLGPPRMAGKKGTIIGSAPSGDTFAVRLESGSIFNIGLQYLEAAPAAGAIAPASVSEAGSMPHASSSTAATSKQASAVSACMGDEDEQLDFVPAQEVMVLGPPPMAGKKGIIVGSAPGDAFTVRLESGSTFQILTQYLKAVDGSMLSAKSSTEHTSAFSATVEDDEGLELMPGQRVVILGPVQLASKKGIIVESAPGNAFTVRLESGNTFQILLRDLKAVERSVPISSSVTAVSSKETPALFSTAESDEGLGFTPGQQVIVLGPPRMTGKKGIIVGPAPGDTFKVRLENGSTFHIMSEYLKAAEGGVPSASASTAVTSKRASTVCAAVKDDQGLEFMPGQQVMLLGPPRMAGKKAIIVGPGSGGTFVVRLWSGSTFQILMEYLQAAESVIPNGSLPILASRKQKSTVSATVTDDEWPEFMPGHQVVVLGPPRMSGKKGFIVGPAFGDTFQVRLESGSTFQIAKEYLKDAGGSTCCILSDSDSAVPSAG